MLVAAGEVVSAVVATAVDPDSPWLFAMAAVYGSLAFPMYSLAVSQINDRFPAHQLVAALFCPLVVYAFVRVVSKTRPIQRRFISLPFRSSSAAAMLAEVSEEE